MQIYRSPMEKILKQLEDNEVIANPKQYTGSLIKRIIYKFNYFSDKLNHLAKRIFHRHPKV